MNETLRRILENRSSRVTDTEYERRLTPYDAADEDSLLTVRNQEGFDQHLKDCGLKKSHRAGVTNIMGSAGFLSEDVPTGPQNTIYHETTVGDVRELSDEDLGKITGVRGIRVLRRLFGRKGDDAEQSGEEELPPFLRKRFKRN